jgi:hypothetical protein
MAVFNDNQSWLEVATISREFTTGVTEIVLPIKLASQVLATVVTTLDARATWRYGGLIYQKINTPFEPTGQSKLASSAYHLGLNQPTLLVYPQYTPDYLLGYLSPKWFSSVQLKVWEFIGDVSNLDFNHQPSLSPNGFPSLSPLLFLQ